ncbi:PAS domain-containing sensor histidine kinase [Fimbriiglobus ruber]|uniref:PAS domain-containing sensor histidine kinase n=1 Tax=Fimbriiglobus ruber TaxID=1908690 RepID=UPI00137AB1B0|nr:PAS domain-containing sensor histidine kinase [Fimbriiglobus ruber]
MPTPPHSREPQPHASTRDAVRLSPGVSAEEGLEQVCQSIYWSHDAAVLTTCAADPPGAVVTFVNPAFTDLTGYPAHEAIGRSPDQLLFGPNTNPAVPVDVLVAVKKGESFECESVVRRKDGTAAAVRSRVVPVRGPSGRAVRSLVFLRDTSGERKAERDARDARAVCDQLFASPALGVALADEDRRLVRVNAAFARMHGYAEHELVGTDLLKLVPPDHRDRAARAHSEYLTQGGPRTQDWLAACKDGSSRRVSGTVGAAVLGNGSRVLVITLADVSDQDRIQAQLRDANKMENVGRLAGGIAHEFNNLLTVVQAFAGMAAEALPPGHEARGHIAQVTRAADHAAQLTRQLLTYARRRPVEPQIVDLSAVVAGIADFLRGTLGDKVKLSIHTRESVHPISADPNLLVQVLVNLAANARDAMPVGGR